MKTPLRRPGAGTRSGPETTTALVKTDSPVGALRPKAAARYLGVGMETLRTSAVPRTYLPGRGAQRGILVYRVVDLDAYLARFVEQDPEPRLRATR